MSDTPDTKQCGICQQHGHSTKEHLTNADFNDPPTKIKITNSDTSLELSGTIRLIPLPHEGKETYQVEGFLSREEPTPPPIKRMKVGLNLGSTSNWAPTFPFVDLTKYAQPISGDKLVVATMDNNAPNGRYTLSWEGLGDCRISPGYNHHINGNQRNVEVGDHTGKNLIINPTEHPKPTNIRLYDQQQGDKVFHPEFLSDTKWATQYRFMDWLRTNNSKVVNWTDFPLPSDTSWHKKPVPPEIIAQLCNIQNVDCLINVPHAATDDCIKKLAATIDHQLDDHLSIGVSYSNEILFNTAFPQYHWAEENLPNVPINIYEGNVPSYTYALRVAHKTVDVWDIFESSCSPQRKIIKIGSGQWNFKIPGEGAGIHRTKLMLRHHRFNEEMDVYELGIYFGKDAMNLDDKPDWEFYPEERLGELLTDKDKVQWQQKARIHLDTHTEHLKKPDGTYPQIQAYECGNHSHHKFNSQQAAQYQKYFRSEHAVEAYNWHLSALEGLGLSAANIFTSHYKAEPDGKFFGVMERRGDVKSPIYRGIQKYLNTQ